MYDPSFSNDLEHYCQRDLPQRDLPRNGDLPSKPPHHRPRRSSIMKVSGRLIRSMVPRIGATDAHLRWIPYLQQSVMCAGSPAANSRGRFVTEPITHSDAPCPCARDTASETRMALPEKGTSCSSILTPRRDRPSRFQHVDPEGVSARARQGKPADEVVWTSCIPLGHGVAQATNRSATEIALQSISLATFTKPLQDSNSKAAPVYSFSFVDVASLRETEGVVRKFPWGWVSTRPLLWILRFRRRWFPTSQFA